MTTKKIQNFVKNIGNAQSNKSIQFSKPKNKNDLHEELFMFDNLESDKEEGDNDQECSLRTENTKTSNDPDTTLAISDTEAKIFDDLDIILNDQDGKHSSNQQPNLRTRTALLGKSVNTALKDAHSAINAMKESIKKKGIRKPSEVTKDPRGGFRKRKAVMAAILREYHDSSNENLVVCEAQNDVEEAPDIIVDDIISEYFESEVLSNDPPLESVQESDEASIDQNIENVIKNEINDTLVDYNPNTADLPPSHNFADTKILIGIGVIFLMVFIFAISKFILGLICGIVMSFGGLKIYEQLFPSTDDSPVCTKKYPHLRDLASPTIPHMVEENSSDGYASAKATFSAWVNAVNSYHPSTYTSASTYSLHISIEGTLLRMRRPKNKISSRVMSTDLRISGVTIVGESTLELLHAKIHLLPYGLVRRRMWSKRYPICITTKKTTDDKSARAAVTTSKLPDSILPGLHSTEENYFFFSRTCREKEETFRRLMAASLGMPINLTMTDIVDKYLSKEKFTNHPIPLLHAHNITNDESANYSQDEIVLTNQRCFSRNVYSSKEPQLVTYVRYMAKFMPSDTLLMKAKSCQIDLNYISCESELLWLNALVGRLVWEVFRGDHWIKVIRDKFQRKLKRLRLPYFVDQLAIVDIDLGTELPVVRNVSRPYLDYRGLWVEFEVQYAGGFSMGLETKINLMKLKKVANQQKTATNKSKRTELYAKYISENVNNQEEHLSNSPGDSDNNSNDITMDTRLQINMSTGGGAVVGEDDEGDGSPNLSTDDSYASTSESELQEEKAVNVSQPSSNKSLLQWVDKITKSSYFLKAADNKFVQRTMEYVSNTSLQLQVDLQYLNGTLAINIPPPPSDRLWWGFKNNPQLNFKARPKVGQKEIQMTKLVDFIEKKLLQEFHNSVVLPNMDDIAIPLLFTGNAEKYSQTLL